MMKQPLWRCECGRSVERWLMSVMILGMILVSEI